MRSKISTLRTVILILTGCLYSLCSTVPVFAQQTQNRTVTGTVVDENKQPLPGVAILIVGSSSGTTTDFDGKFSLTLPAGSSELQFSFIGYETVILTVPSENVIRLQMKPQTTTLEDVVVIGYGTRRKSDLTGAVTNVSSKDFNEGVISSPEELINGKIAGVQITNSGGSPNSSSTIRIRGGASLNASNDPLIVIDGVPLEVGSSVSGISNPLSLINPNDIESMSILKDASSTAIYGSRASNGVIIITTKKGGSDRLKVSLQSTNSIATLDRTADMLSYNEFVNIIRRFGSESQQALLGEYKTDWNDAIYRNAFGTDNSLAVSGRFTEYFPFRVALGASSQDGILETDNSNRYTASINLAPSLLDDHLKITVSGKGSYSRIRRGNTNALWGAASMNPTIPIYYQGDDENYDFGGYNEAVYIVGEGADAKYTKVNGATANPLGVLTQTKDRSKVYRLIGNAEIDYKLHPLPELRFHLIGGYDYSTGKGTYIVLPEAFSEYATGGSRNKWGSQKNYNRMLTAYANYNKNFEAIKSNIDVTFGYDYQYWKTTYPAEYQWSYAGPQYDGSGNPTGYLSSSAAVHQEHSLLSYYGRLNYSFDSKYMLTATFRRDGSSRFAPERRWGTFPSVALAYRLSQENYWAPLSSVVNDFKIRASYGVTGQQDGIANYSYLSVYTPSQEGAYYWMNGHYISTYRPEAYNSGLKWETTKSWDVGFDFGLFDNRITGSFDWYTRKTEDLLATVPVPAGTNFAKEILSNVGNVDSKGVEMAISANIIRTSDWSWDVSANAAWQRLKITNLTLVPGADSPDTGVGPTVEGQNVQVFSTGYAPYAFYVYKQIYDERTGKPIEGSYADLDGDGDITTGDLYHYHSPAPDWILGFSTSLRYKKWTLSTSLRANIGNYAYNGLACSMGAWEAVQYNTAQLNNLNRSFLDTEFSVRQPLSDYYVENASFLKMDNLQLSYNFGRIFNTLDLNMSVMVQNVFCITQYKGLDPEVAGGVDGAVYPRPRTYSLTIGLNF